MKLLLTIFALCVLISPQLLQAETVLRISDSIAVEVDQIVSGDFYGATGLSGSVSLSGTIEGDAVVVGNSVTSNGTITGDLLSISGTAQVHASVTDDVRIVAGEVTIAEFVGGDVFVIAGTLNILSSAEIDGDVFFYGGKGEINGTIGGSVYGTSEYLRIDGLVKGSVDVITAQTLTIGGRADIAGDVSYASSQDIIRAQDSVVVGSIIATAKPERALSVQSTLAPLLMFAFLTLLVFILLRKKIDSLLFIAAPITFTRYGLIGLAGAFTIPLLILLLMVSLVGVLVGGLVLFGFLTLLLLAFALTPIFTGSLLQQYVFKKPGVSLTSTLLGIVALEIISFIPLIGPALIAALLFVMFGMLLVRFYKYLT